MAKEDARPEVEFEHSSDRVDVGGVGHVSRGVVAALKRLPEVVDLHLGWGKASRLFVHVDSDFNTWLPETLKMPWWWSP